MAELNVSTVAELANSCDAVADRWDEVCQEFAAKLRAGELPGVENDDAGVTLSMRESADIVKALAVLRQVLPPRSPAPVQQPATTLPVAAEAAI